MVPTCVSSLRSQNPFFAVPAASRIASACAAITSLTPASSSARAKSASPLAALLEEAGRRENVLRYSVHCGSRPLEPFSGQKGF